MLERVQNVVVFLVAFQNLVQRRLSHSLLLLLQLKQVFLLQLPFLFSKHHLSILLLTENLCLEVALGNLVSSLLLFFLKFYRLKRFVAPNLFLMFFLGVHVVVKHIFPEVVLFFDSIESFLILQLKVLRKFGQMLFLLHPN